MTGYAFDRCAAIASYSASLADIAEVAVPDSRIAHCPEWMLADLVWHLTETQWFWATIVEERLAERPPEERRPKRPADDTLVDGLRAASANLVRALGAADPADAVWTWAPGHQNAGFVERHQVQEAAVHHFDAANAAGARWAMDPLAAADAVDEFLTFSVSSEADPADPPRPALGGTFGLSCSDLDASWTVTDGGIPGTVCHSAGVADGVPAITAPSPDLLLWLYDRTSMGRSDVPAALLARFRNLCFTD